MSDARKRATEARRSREWERARKAAEQVPVGWRWALARWALVPVLQAHEPQGDDQAKTKRATVKRCEALLQVLGGGLREAAPEGMVDDDRWKAAVRAGAKLDGKPRRRCLAWWVVDRHVEELESHERPAVRDLAEGVEGLMVTLERQMKDHAADWAPPPRHRRRPRRPFYVHRVVPEAELYVVGAGQTS